MTDITKEELHAYTDATNRTATALEKIADRLENITAQGAECGDKMDQILEKITEGAVYLKEVNRRSKQVASNVLWVKWLWTVLAGVVALGMIITQLIDKVGA